jgi:ring-1,2-phenylacetyl-CoA epoxidase subunit PaaB
VHAPDAKMALQLARDVYTRRQEGVSIWVVRADHIVASDPQAKPEFFDPAEDKIYRHPTFYELPDEVKHM